MANTERLAAAAGHTEQRRSTMTLVKRLAYGYLRPHVGRLGLAVVFMLVAAAMTGALARLMEPVIDEVFAAQNRAVLLPIALAVFGAFFVRGIATYFHSVLMNHVGQSIVAGVQQRLYSHLMRADLALFQHLTAGQLISRLISDVNVMRNAVAECLTGIGKSLVTIVILVGVMFYQDWRLSIAALLVFPLAAGTVAVLGRKVRKVSGATQAELGNFSSKLNQTFQGVRQVKAYGMETHEEERVGGTIQRLFHLAHKTFRLSAMSTPVSEMLAGIAIVTVIVYGGSRVIAGESTAGQLFSFITAFLLAYEPMKKLARLNVLLQQGLAAADRIFNLMDVEPRIVDRPDAETLRVNRPSIRFDKVTFEYPDGSPALETFDLDIPAGATVALVGPSGAGKSTVLNLIPRFYDVSDGRVLIDGHDVRDVTTASLRANIALVSQEVAIFDDTVRANIAYGRWDASEDEIMAAARAAAAHEFIIGLSEGYDTRLGENGIKLSGGQRQRISIARAMLRDAPILLLDEATSALDTESERAIQEGLRRLRANRTTLVIAHRLSTVLDADLICVLDGGRLVEEGTHASLLARGGLYSRLYLTQIEADTDLIADPEIASASNRPSGGTPPPLKSTAG